MVDEVDDRPVVGVLVRLVDLSGEPLAISISDSTGAYRVQADVPGTYRLEAARLGYRKLETPQLELPSADGTYEVDMVLQAAPVELPGFTVETTRLSDEEVDRRVRLMVGLSPASLRVEPILRDVIVGHVERGHDLADLMRWGNTAGIVTLETNEGPCFQARGRGCIPIYLNGAAFSAELIDVLPLDMIEMVVVLYPKESIAYPGGAVLMYTDAWIR